MYKGFGASRGIHVAEEDGFAYAVTYIEHLNSAEQEILIQMFRTGITAREFEEWYFSGSFVQVEEQ